MSWNAQRSEERIKKFLTTVPSVEAGVTLAKYNARLTEARTRGALDELTNRRTFLVSGAHLYGQLLRFDDLVAEQGRETPNSHARILAFLDEYYRVWDAIVEEDESHRVDYHGPRVHAVITEPASSPAEQIAKAVALAVKLASAAKQIGSAHGIDPRVRFGIDHGRCLAMATGRAHEREVLFLGSPANHAAKVAAGDIEGIFLAPGAEAVLGSTVFAKSQRGESQLTEAFASDAVSRFRFARIDAALGSVSETRKSASAFSFTRPTPPLAKSVKFSDLSPAKSARIGSAVLFADVDQYTRFVDQAIRNGAAAIEIAVRVIHVIREELNAVLQEDFGGKRIRFIGDCIHGCLAEGQVNDAPALAVEKSAYCAAGMRSSFDLCLRLAAPGAPLGLAIGIEYGPAAITRLGTRGDDSVRCATGRAVVDAERVQQSIASSGVKMGPVALQHASREIVQHFGDSSRLLSYAATADVLASVKSPAVQVVREQPSARPHSR